MQRRKEEKRQAITDITRKTVVQSAPEKMLAELMDLDETAPVFMAQVGQIQPSTAAVLA